MTADDMMTDDENELPTETCGICGGDIDHHTDADGRVYWTHGHNAAPLVDGRCCDACNEHVVAARINMGYVPQDHPWYSQIIPHFLTLCLSEEVSA